MVATLLHMCMSRDPSFYSRRLIFAYNAQIACACAYRFLGCWRKQTTWAVRLLQAPHPSGQARAPDRERPAAHDSFGWAGAGPWAIWCAWTHCHAHGMRMYLPCCSEVAGKKQHGPTPWANLVGESRIAKAVGHPLFVATLRLQHSQSSERGKKISRRGHKNCLRRITCTRDQAVMVEQEPEYRLRRILYQDTNNSLVHHSEKENEVAGSKPQEAYLSLFPAWDPGLLWCLWGETLSP